MSSKDIVKIALKAIEDIKGQGVRCINVDKLTSITDYMVMATGTSNIHVKSLADAVVKEVKEAGLQIVGVEGKALLNPFFKLKVPLSIILNKTSICSFSRS